MSRRDRRVLRDPLSTGRGPMISDVDDDVLFTKMLNDAKAENELLPQPVEVNELAARVQREFREIKSGQSGRARPMVITLCGSTRFKQDFVAEQERLTLAGHIVISVGIFGWKAPTPFCKYVFDIAGERQECGFTQEAHEEPRDWTHDFVGDEGVAPEVGLGEAVKSMLDQLHLRKIDISDGIHVINKDGYIGTSTAREIDYAIKLGKAVTYMEDEDDE